VIGAMTSEQIANLFRIAGTLRPFECTECEGRGLFVSGPHSHVCSVCGERAYYGFYTTPLCVKHHRDVAS
jgi:hypothetical protein